jgi:hypothetical protein
MERILLERFPLQIIEEMDGNSNFLTDFIRPDKESLNEILEGIGSIDTHKGKVRYLLGN